MAFPAPNIAPFDLHESRDDVGCRWDKWIKRFDLFLDAFAIADPHRKKSLLLYYAGQDVQDIFETFQHPQQPAQPPAPDEYVTAKQALNNYFLSQRNTLVEEFKFRQATQLPCESINEYTIRLKALALSCDFNDAKKEILGHLINTCSSSSLRRKALREPALTLDDFLTIAKSYELAEEQATLIETKTIGSTTTNALRHKLPSQALPTDPLHNTQQQQNPLPHRTQTYPRFTNNQTLTYRHPSPPQQFPSFHQNQYPLPRIPQQQLQLPTCSHSRQATVRPQQSPLPTSICYNCGGPFPHAQGRQSCPARNGTCTWCGRLGHIEAMCRSKAHDERVTTAAMITVEEPLEDDADTNIDYQQEDEILHIFTLTPSLESIINNSNEKLQPKKTNMMRIFDIHGLKIPALQDSGSCLNILDFKTFSDIQPRPLLEGSSVRVFPYASKEPLPFVGVVFVGIEPGHS